MAAHAAEGGNLDVPSGPGIFVKVKTGDEALIELTPVKMFQYQLAGKDGAPAAADQAAKLYFVGKPEVKVNLSEVEGFYVSGDFNPAAFSIVEYTPAKIRKKEVVPGSDTGKGVEKIGTFVENGTGWAVGKNLQPIEKTPKLFWIPAQENMHSAAKGASFLAVTFGGGQYLPFVDFNDYERFEAWAKLKLDPVFGNPLRKAFHPINEFTKRFYKPYAMICALGLFLSAMLWVNLILKKDYVNKGRPLQAWYTDLRLWTVISMLPHVLVYFYFNK